MKPHEGAACTGELANKPPPEGFLKCVRCEATRLAELTIAEGDRCEWCGGPMKPREWEGWTDGE